MHDKLYVIGQVILALLVVLFVSIAQGATIEAEDYNQGGEGVAYHDYDPENRGNAGIREDEGVDLWTPEGSDIIRIGSTRTDEWVTWDYDFPEGGTYAIKFYTGTPNDNTTFKLKVDGKEYTVAVPNNGSYNTDGEVVQEVEIGGSGVETIRVTVLNNSFDVDRFDITAKELPQDNNDLTGLSNKQKHDYVTYVATTEKRFEVSWDEVENAEWYEIRIFHLEKNVYINLDEDDDPTIIKVEDIKKQFGFPYSGHFVPQIRSCRNPTDDETEKVCSDSWSNSIDPAVAMVDGEQKAWWLYGHTAPPGPIE